MTTSGYLYKRTESNLWTVGFYDPTGKWNPESDFNSEQDASERVNYLNGGNSIVHESTLHHVMLDYELRAEASDDELADLRATVETFRDLLVYLNAASAADAYSAVRSMMDDNVRKDLRIAALEAAISDAMEQIENGDTRFAWLLLDVAYRTSTAHQEQAK